jgi:outer membrane protein assembly factor BamB
LSGLRESDGTLLWSHEISKQGGFPGDLSSPFQESGGLLYFATNVAEQNDLELDALQITRGTLIWHRQVTDQQSISGRELALGDGTLYLPYTVLAQGTAGLFIQAIQASDGVLRWKKHPGQAGAPGLVIVDGTTASTVFAESSDSQHSPLIGLNAGNGATLWQNQQWVVYREIIADGKLIVFSRLNDLNQQLCALQPATSAVLWCHNVDKYQGWAIAGP